MLAMEHYFCWIKKKVDIVKYNIINGDKTAADIQHHLLSLPHGPLLHTRARNHTHYVYNMKPSYSHTRKIHINPQKLNNCTYLFILLYLCLF